MVELFQPATGEIDYGTDRDWFATELEAGGVCRFKKKSRVSGHGILVLPHLHVISDADGNVIDCTEGPCDSRFNSAVTFTPS